MADSTHMGGMYFGVAASTILADILGDISYTLDVSLRNISLYGWLPIASRRDNLAQVAFAIGALVDTSGSDCVRIYPQKSNVSVTYEEGEIFDGAQLETADVVTRIELTEHAFRSDSTETKELYKSALNGSATVTFSEPMHSLSIAGGNITNSGANYAVISATGSNVMLSGIPYRHDTRICSMNNPNSGAMDRENVVRVADATLVSVYNSASVLLRLFERYKKRNTITAKMLLGDAMPGDVVSLETKYDGVKTGVIQSIDLNLARKRIGQAVILCQ